MTQYDSIAEQYDQSVNTRSDREVIFIPSAKHFLGDLHGKQVLDLACGSGFFTRFMKEWGASHVVGVDISSEMVELAKQQEKKEPLGIEYLVGDVAQLGKIGEFDVVFGGFLLHYASSVEQLELMIRSIGLNLKPGGKFIAFNENPSVPTHSGIKYGVKVETEGPIQDATKVKRSHYVGDKFDFVIEHFHYEPGTYQRALRSAGFTEIEWTNFVSASGPDFDEKYWWDFLHDFSVAVLKCCKGT
ncbi:MAG: class I SAM-dependent methyltransferase [Candidatus Obscuribacterales bacterium]|nr:class I SAM-dependent methyltransferase [Candidatus Obscuribacterales bacterium]